MRLLLLFAGLASAACLPVLAPTEAHAQVSSAFLRQLDLETAWKGQVQLPKFGRGLVSTHLWVNPKDATQYAVVKLPERTIRIAADTPDRKGQPIGLEEAKKRAVEYATRLAGKPDGIAAEEVTVPQVKLVVATCDGLLQCLDAETGKLLWSTACGTSTAPAYAAGISDAGVSIVHGGTLYTCNWDTGKILHSKRLGNASSKFFAACANTGFVADVRGHIEACGLNFAFKNPFGYILTGHVVGKPVSLENGLYCALASDAGYVYVFAGGDQPSEWIRYESSSAISGCLGAGNNAFYAGNESGVISKITVDERLGRVMWEFHSGQATSSVPLVIGNTVYVASEVGNVSAIDDTTGFARWQSNESNVSQMIGESGNQVLGFTGAGELVAMEKGSGRLLGTANVGALAHAIQNQVTDRIYVVNQIGQVQCIRPTGEEFPKLVKPVKVSVTEKGTAGMGATQPDPKATSPFDPAAGGATDPFGTGNGGGTDPFGGAGGSDPFGGAGRSDPFGGDAGGDPFGGGDDGSMADPFGGAGGSDPFGGSGN